MAGRVPKVFTDSFSPPGKVSWFEALTRYRKGDVWEQRVNDWGVWEEDLLGRWIWDGKQWEAVDIH